MANSNTFYVWLFSLCLTIFFNSIHLSVTQMTKIGILWDKEVIPTNTHLQPSLDTIASISSNATVEVSYVDITDKMPFHIYNEICDEISSGTVAFISAGSCYTGVSINRIAKDLSFPLVALEAGCDFGGMGSFDNIFPFPQIKNYIGEAVTDSISALGWMNIALFYDRSTGDKLDSVMEELSMSNATVQAFNIRPENQMEDIMESLNNITERYAFPAQIIVLCSLQTTQRILLEANKYGRKLMVGQDVQAYFTFQTKWLLVAERSWLPELQRLGVDDIDNIAAIVPMRSTDKSPESLLEEAFSFVLDAVESHLETKPEVTSPSEDKTECDGSKTAFTDISDNLDGLFFSSQSMFGSEYGVYTAYRRGMSGMHMREFQLVSEWDPPNEEPMGNFFPNLGFGMNARELVVTTNLWPPFVGKNDSATGTEAYIGLCIEMLYELSRNLNFTFTIIEPEDGQWGGWINDSIPTGLAGQMYRKEADMVVAPMASTIDREAVMDFTEPWFQEYTTVMVRLPNPDASKWKLYMSPFKWQVWACIGLSIPFAGIAIWLVTMYSPCYTKEELTKGLATFDNALMYALGAILSQGGIYLPTAQSGRFVVGFWWMYCIVVVATYSGNLIAFLTVSKPTLPFQDLQGMVDQNEYDFGTLGGSAFVTNIAMSRAGVLVELNRQLQKMYRSNPDTLSTDHSLHVNKVLDDKYAYIGDKTSFEIEMSSQCDLELIKEEFLPMQYAVGLHNNSAYNVFVSSGVSKIIEGGLINKWKQKWWPRQSFCSRGLVTEAKAVTLKDVQGAYYALGILILIGACILMAEHGIKHLLPEHYKPSALLKSAKEALLDNRKSKGYFGGYANGYANGILPNEKSKGDPNDIRSGAPVFSRSLWS